MLEKPNKEHYPEYFENYISLSPDNILDSLEIQLEDSINFYRSLSSAQLYSKYEENKWSIQEVLGHCLDVERIFAYRALRFSRLDQTGLHGYDDDKYVQQAFFDEIEIKHLLDEYFHLRKSTIRMFRNFHPSCWSNHGLSSGETMILSAIPFIIYGHEEHHKRIIRERYLK